MTVETSAPPAGELALETSRWQRMLLPGAMVDAPGGGRTVRDWVVDAVSFGLALAIGGLAFASTLAEHSPAGIAIDVALGIVSLAALWVRREHPLGVAVLTIVASAFSGVAGGPALVAVFNAAIRCRRGALPWIALGGFLASALYSFLYPEDGTYAGDLVLAALLIGVAVGWGLFVRSRRELIVSLRERATRLEGEHQRRAEQARDGERRRIAREMHDVLAHRISLLSLHAGALEFRPDATPEEIAGAAGVIRSSAHAALEELRDVIGVLREGTEGATQPPQPTLRDLPELIAEARAAGMRVEAKLELALDGDDAAAVSELSGRTGYRIVQEGLTNVRKHAPDVAVTVRVALTEEGLLVLEVRNPRPLGAPLGRDGEAPFPDSGSGLIGLGERVALAGGELSHGPDGHGAYLLRATLPAERS